MLGLVLLAGLLLLGTAQTPAKPCVYTAKDPATGATFSYDFSSLTGKGIADQWAVDYPEDRETGFVFCSKLRGPLRSEIPVCRHFEFVCTCQLVQRRANPAVHVHPHIARTSLGTMKSWAVQPYSDPISNVRKYDGGVVVTIRGGDKCSDWSDARGQAYMYLRCVSPLVVCLGLKSTTR